MAVEVTGLNTDRVFAWQAVGETIHIFADAMEDNKHTGHRLHLGRLEAGDLVLAFPLPQGSYYVSVAAEAGSSSTLSPLTASEVLQLPDAAQRLEKFIASFSWLLAAGVPPAKVRRRLLPGRIIKTAAGEEVNGPAAVVWCRQEQGSSRYAGGQALEPLGAGDCFPLPPNLWIRTEEPSQIGIFPTERYLQQQEGLHERLAADLGRFCALVSSAALERLAEREVADCIGRERRERNDSEAVQEALHGVCGVLGGAGTGNEGDAVFQACRNVAAALSVPLRRPGADPLPGEDPLRHILRANHLMSREIRLAEGWQQGDGGPLIGFLKPSADPADKLPAGPVALLPGHNGYCLKPGRAEGLVLSPDLLMRLEPLALRVYPSLGAAKVSWKKMAQLAFTGCAVDIRRLLVCGLLAGALGFAFPMLTSYVINEVIDTGDHATLWQVAAGLLCAVAGSAVFGVARGVAFVRTEGRAANHLQPALFQRLLELPVGFFRQFTAGDLARRVLAVDNVRRLVVAQSGGTLLSLLFAGLNVILMLLYCWPLGLLSIGIALLSLLCILILCKRQMTMQATSEDTIGKIAGIELQYVTGISKLRVAGAEDRAFARWAEYFATLRALTYRLGLASAAVQTFGAVLPLLTTILVYYVLVHYELNQTLSVGGFLCFSSALGQFTGALVTLSAVALSLTMARPMFARALPILQTTAEYSERRASPGQLKGSIETNNVFFAYGSGPRVLSGVSIKAAPGEFVAIVGPSGSGKSSLLRLLLGFEKAQTGTIYYDGQDLSLLDIGELRRQLGVVQQNGAILAGSIFENITGNDSGLTLQDAWAAAELAGLAEEIRGMPMQMHTVMPQGGGTLSGGQRQRLLIARMLASRPKIVLLDEATSALDNASQLIVQRSLERLQATRIVIAHRLSTIAGADRIYVMAGGKVVQEGTFQSLLSDRNGLFARLADRQSI